MKALSPQPTYTTDDLEEVLATESQIAERVSTLARDISEHYGSQDITVVCVLSGALVFTADLIRKLDVPTRLDCIRADSYGNSTEAAQPPRITNPLKTDIKDRHVLIVDDILDTGNTLASILSHLRQAGPASLRTCVLLDKKERRKVDLEADFSGFEIPDAFVVGYGLDYAEHYRNLKCIGSLKTAFQSAES